MKRVVMLGMLMFFVASVALGEEFTLTIVHTNDTHSRLDDMARQATLVEEIRAQNENLLLLHAGDAFTGTLYFTVHQGAADAWIMNAIGFSAMALGNHEFDGGPAVLSTFASEVSFPLLCANFDFTGEPALAGKILPYTILDIDGKRVGIFGLTTEDTAWSSSPGPNIVIGDAAFFAQKAVADLTAQGVDVIIALTHLGWDRDLELAETVPGIDIIVGGHSHTLPEEYPTVVERKLLNVNTASFAELQTLPGIGPVIAQRIIDWRTKNPFQKVEDLLQVSGIGPARLAAIRNLVTVSDEPVRTLVVQAGEHAQHLGQLTVTFDLGLVKSWTGKLISVKDVPPHPVLSEKLAVFSEPIAALAAQVIGETKVELDGERARVRSQETNLGNLVADAILWKAQVAGAQIALWNGGGIRASVPQGPVSWGDCMNILPYGNYLVVLEVTGKQILQALENGVSLVEELKGRFPHVAGLRFVWDPSASPGFRIVSVEVFVDEIWQPLDLAATYRLATSNFLAQGGDGYEMFKEALNSWNLGFVDYEILAEYIESHSPVAPQVEGRIVRK